MADHSDLDTEEDKRRDAAFSARKATAIFAAKLLAGGWFFIAVLVAFLAGKPGDGILQMDPNEWGDFLAGVFAPAAFIGVIATVWLQSIELEAQREELKQTRREFSLNRKVLEEQASFIGAQTEILNAQETARRQDRAETAIETFLDLLTLNLVNIMTAERPISGEDPSTSFSTLRDLIPDGARPSTAFQHYARHMVDQVGHFRKFGRVSVRNIDSVRIARQRLQDSLELIPDITSSARVRVHAELQLQLAESLDLIISHEERGAEADGE